MTQLVQLRSELDEARSRTDSLFALMSAHAMYERPIPERHRLIFYLGHLEAFDWNQICRWTLGISAFHQSFDQLFEAGIDPSGG
ncbi:MAG: DinB family protein, partial [Nitrospirota bacterium]|nr:DinB family protein [Nitrospirota bacterium]